jgi:ATP-binding cassette subfamily B protein
MTNDSRPFQRAPGTPALPTTPARFIRFFIRKFRWWYGAMLVLVTADAVCGITIPYGVSRVLKTVTAAPDARPTMESLRTPLLLFLGLAVGEVVFGRLAGAIQIRLGPRQRQNVTRALYHYLQYHSHRFLTSDFAGALAHRISETSLGVTQTLWSVLTEFWPAAVALAVSITLLTTAHAELGMFVFAWAAIFVSLSFWLARRARAFAVAAAAARSETTGKVVDSVTNLTSARLFARLGFEREYLDSYLAKERKAIHRSNTYAERVRWFQFASAAVLKVGTLYYALRLWQSGAIDVAQFVMAVSLALLIINEVRNLARRFLEFFEYVGNVANGVHTIVRPHELIDLPGAKPAHVTRGAIAFEDVTFHYPSGRNLFEQLSVSIPAGQRVGLVGSSGSGKSTFVSLILRMYDPQSGRIFVDGIDIESMTQDSLHAQISLIPQDPSLFHRTLMENIRYGRIEARDEEVFDAARRAHAHEFIAQMQEGYASMVGERGVKLSGGQRQRIAIARVVLKNAPVLILDEATSSLDSITERAIQETLDDVMIGKTVIVVAHRLSTIAHLDRILVFEHGRIIEDGSHADLLAQGGAYYQLWTRQTGGFLMDDSDTAPTTTLAPRLALETEVVDAAPLDEDLRGVADRPSEQSDPATGAAVATRVKLRR